MCGIKYYIQQCTSLLEHSEVHCCTCHLLLQLCCKLSTLKGLGHILHSNSYVHCNNRNIPSHYKKIIL